MQFKQILSVIQTNKFYQEQWKKTSNRIADDGNPYRYYSLPRSVEPDSSENSIAAHLLALKDQDAPIEKVFPTKNLKGTHLITFEDTFNLKGTNITQTSTFWDYKNIENRSDLINCKSVIHMNISLKCCCIKVKDEANFQM